VSYEGIFGEDQLRRGVVALGGMAGRGFGGNALYARSPSPMTAAKSVTGTTGLALSTQPQAAVATKGATSTPAVVSAGAAPAKDELKELSAADAEGLSGLADGSAANKPADPATKLDESLRDLAEAVKKQGRDGSFTSGAVTVTAYKLDVMVYLSDTSPQTMEALKKLGFEISGESKAVRVLFGTIDVRKLKELAKLDAVRSVKPVGT
jgi:hypothetical protein